MSFTILLLATALMGLVAEVLVNSVEPILTASGISEVCPCDADVGLDLLGALEGAAEFVRHTQPDPHAN
jgi:Ca2+/H+ antiporter